MGTDNRNLIVSAVFDAMKTIRTSAGYETDSGSRVFLWRSSPVNPGECPAIDVRDPSRRELQKLSGGVTDYELTVEVVAFASGTDSNADLDAAVRDILKCILEGDTTFGDLAIQTNFEGDRKGIDQRESKVALSIVRFLIHYRKT